MNIFPIRCSLFALALAAIPLITTFGATTVCAAGVSVVPEAQAALPEAVRRSGVLHVATSLQWAPFDYVGEDGKPTGIDIRLMTLLSAKLGLKPEFQDIKFPSIVPGVQSGRFDAGVDQIGVTEARAKVVDFVPYFSSGYGLLVRKGTKGVDVNSLCGKTLALTQGSAQVAVAEELSKACTAAGKKEIGMQYYPDSADTYMAVANGRGDGFLSAKAVGIYTSKMNTKLEMTEATIPGKDTLSGIVVGKGNAALKKALTLALESAMKDGSYAAIMKDYGVPDGAISHDQLITPPKF